jgi:hypothetical protein
MLKKIGFLLFFLLAASAAIYFWGGRIASALFGLRTTTDSTISLLQTERLAELETAEFTGEFIFPFDFIEKPYPNWTVLRAKALNNVPLSAAEQGHYAFYQACLERGLDLSVYNNSLYFPVVIKASAGFNLKDRAWITRSADGASIVITLPPAELLSFAVVDGSSVREGWPDVALTPETWGRVIAFILPAVKERPEFTELLDIAAENGRTLLRTAFASAQTQVEFFEEEGQL